MLGESPDAVAAGAWLIAVHYRGGFGGQVLGLSLRAAIKTLDTGKAWTLHSQHVSYSLGRESKTQPTDAVSLVVLLPSTVRQP